MNIRQGDFLSCGLGVRRKDLAILPEEIRSEFDRLGDINAKHDPKTRKRCWELAGPLRRARARVHWHATGRCW